VDNPIIRKADLEQVLGDLVMSVGAVLSLIVNDLHKQTGLSATFNEKLATVQSHLAAKASGPDRLAGQIVIALTQMLQEAGPDDGRSTSPSRQWKPEIIVGGKLE
jgi:hypothetical protein